MDYQKLMEQRNRNNPFAKLLGITITEISEGHATAELSVREDHFNPQNSVHGGCLFSLADAACGSAGASYGWNITTIDSDFHFLRAGLTSTRLIAEATCIKPGKSIMVMEVRVTDQTGQLLAAGIYTLSRLKTMIDLF